MGWNLGRVLLCLLQLDFISDIDSISVVGELAGCATFCRVFLVGTMRVLRGDVFSPCRILAQTQNRLATPASMATTM